MALVRRRAGFLRVVGLAVHWCGWPFWYLVLRNTNRVRVVVVCGDYVLLERSFVSSRAWGLPGGGMRPHESAADAAQRELYEETRIHIAGNDLRQLGDEQVVDVMIRYHAHYVVVQVDRAVMDMAVPRLEVAELCWVRRDELQNIHVLNSVRRAVQLLADS